jgi:glycosyltransferase involved in cell wall biosynthesis
LSADRGIAIANHKANGMKLTVLSVAYPLTEVGIDAVGGSEQILTLLDRSLVSLGHRSLVIAAEGSKVEGTLIASPRATGRLDDSVRDSGRRIHRKLIKGALAQYPIDLIHMHSLDFHAYVPPGDIPVLATLHLPPAWYPRKIFQQRKNRYQLNCVSQSQHRSCPPSTHLLPPIPNGVDVERLRIDVPRKAFALALGRICPEKGFHFALDAAKRAKTELVLAGQVFPYRSHLDYFRRTIRPRLDGKRRFIGPVGFDKKRLLLSQAKCLMIPSTVPETSSLVAMEALACGTPVIAFRSGALPEIIDHGRTGFLVSDIAEMSRALRDVDDLSPETCRRVARTRFSAQTMTSRYLRVYQSLVQDNSGGRSPDYRYVTQWAGSP